MLKHAYAVRQRARFMLPDALKFVRPDAARFLRIGTNPADVYPALAPRRDAVFRADARAVAETLTAERAVLDGLRRDLATIKSDLAWRQLLRAVAQKYSNSQPRVPAGSGRESGRWTSGGGGSSTAEFGSTSGVGETEEEPVADGSDSNPGFDEAADSSDNSNGYSNSGDGSINDRTGADRQPIGITDTRVVSDADPESVKPGEQYAGNLRSLRDSNGNLYYRPGGHHVYPQAEFNKLNLPPETRRVFEEATTGTLSKSSVRTFPNGTPVSHYWDKAHREYSTAVNELATDFIQRNRIDPRLMTPPQAMDLLADIQKSEDPRIRDYNRAVRMQNRIFRFRSGRSE